MCFIHSKQIKAWVFALVFRCSTAIYNIPHQLCVLVYYFRQYILFVGVCTTTDASECRCMNASHNVCMASSASPIIIASKGMLHIRNSWILVSLSVRYFFFILFSYYVHPERESKYCFGLIGVEKLATFGSFWLYAFFVLFGLFIPWQYEYGKCMKMLLRAKKNYVPCILFTRKKIGSILSLGKFLGYFLHVTAGFS